MTWGSIGSAPSGDVSAQDLLEEEEGSPSPERGKSVR